MNSARNLSRVWPVPSIGSSHPHQHNLAPQGQLPHETLTETIILPPEREVVLKTIEYLRGLRDNFDGQGTLIPTVESLDTAQRIVELCFGRMYPTAVYPAIERTVALSYERADFEGSLRLLVEQNKVSATKFSATGKFQILGSFSVPPQSVALPKDVLAVLPHYQIR